MTVKVLIQQPVLPRYRVSFFRSLGKMEDLNLTILYSPSIPGFPISVDHVADEFEMRPVACKTVLGNRFFQQRIDSVKGQMADFDVVVINSNPRFLSNFPLCRIASQQQCSLVSWNHAVSSTSGKLSRRLRLWHTKRQFSHHLVYTDPEVDRLVSYGFDESIITPLNNTIDTTEVTDAISKHCPTGSCDDPVEAIMQLRKNLPEPMCSVLQQQGLEAGKFFLFCGRLTEKARLGQLLDVCSKLTTKVKFAIVGDGELMSDLREKCRILGIEDRVVFVGKIEEQEKLAPYFLGAKVMVYPGSIGLSLNHAFAFGLPVVTHGDASDHMPEFFYLRPDQNGFLFLQNNIDDLAGVLEKLANKDLASISRNSLETVYTKFTFNGMVGRFASAMRLAAGRQKTQIKSEGYDA
jgi:glycosyltransferase involved in cell wall biosynthesis